MTNSDTMSLPASRWKDKAEITALLGAFCFFLSAIEYMIPKPLPFMRLGIANLPILLAVDILPLPWFLILAVVKVVGMSLVSGSLFSYIAIFSLAGTLTAALVMWTARKAGGKFISSIGVSVLGAVASNGVQILLAMVVVFGQAAKLIAPVFLGMGLATGTLLGIFTEVFVRRSLWYARATGLPDAAEKSDGLPGEASAGQVDGSATSREGETHRGFDAWKAHGAAKKASRLEKNRARRGLRRETYERLFNPALLAAAGFSISVAFLFQRSLALKTLLFLIFVLVSVSSGKKFSFLTTFSVMAGIIAANLLVPVGKVIGHIGPLPVTLTALEEGISKAVVFEGLISISRASILPTLRLPGRFGSIIASAFVYYDRIIEYRGSIHPATLMGDADRLMLRVWDQQSDPHVASRAASPIPHRGTAAGHIFLATAVLAAYLLLFL
jgi:heptaprenyl diphosphate synthase